MNRRSEIGGRIDKFRVAVIRDLAVSAQIDPFRLVTKVSLQRQRERRRVVPDEVARFAVPMQFAFGNGDQDCRQALMFEPIGNLHAAPFRAGELRRGKNDDVAGLTQDRLKRRP
ncbi:MAG: hypothetical protein AB7E84_02715 [Xanthobacteraceae bacterium]